MRWFTCTPQHFVGNQSFFDRESGLTSVGFSLLGVESGAIALGPSGLDDLPIMTRANWDDLENPDWWRGIRLDGLVFYTWGNQRYRPMVSAAMAAGVRVVQVTDTQGAQSPFSDFGAHLKSERAHYWHEPLWKQAIMTAMKLPVSITYRAFTRDKEYAKTILASHYFLASTPMAARRYQRLVRFFFDEGAAERVKMVPIPVNSHFKFHSNDRKEKEVIAVGRWDSHQKRTPLLLATIAETLKTRDDVLFRVFGTITADMEKWHQSLPAAARELVVLEGLVPNAELASAYRRARVMLVSAAYEGCHNASAEAICSGASVVACRSPFLSALEWHASKNSGRLSELATATGMSRSLMAELKSWDNGGRDPVTISSNWVSEFHPNRVAKAIMDLFGFQTGSGDSCSDAANL